MDLRGPRDHKVKLGQKAIKELVVLLVLREQQVHREKLVKTELRVLPDHLAQQAQWVKKEIMVLKALLDLLGLLAQLDPQDQKATKD
jgi:hypothetical protein